MSTNFTSIFTSGLTAAAMVAALFIAGPVQAESRTFPYGTLGSAKYEGVAPAHVRKSYNRSFNKSLKRSRSALRMKRKNRPKGFHSRTRIKISR